MADQAVFEAFVKKVKTERTPDTDTTKLYAEDTCCLKSNPSKIGLVDRTYNDVSTHIPDPRRHYLEGLERHRDIPKRQYDDFLHSGIPPRGSVIITWAQFPGETVAKTTLIPELALSLVDRMLLAGDVVKRNVRDAMSGTVMRTSMNCDLLPPLSWTITRGQEAQNTFAIRHQDNISTQSSRLLHEIPGAELTLSGSYNRGDVVIYKDWIGKILETQEDVSVRLSNNSVVTVEDPAVLEPVLLDEPYQVGDFVTTKKANLRRGRWIFGSYNPSVEPQGHVAEVRVTSVEVTWLVQRYPTEGIMTSSQPPYVLDQDVLDSGEIFVYDRHRADHTKLLGTGGILTTCSDFCVGDRVRFRNLAWAAGKYTGTDRHGKLVPVPKTASLGFDINVFMVGRTSSQSTVLWQDMTTSTVNTIDLIPELDVDDDSLWPGEIVMTRKDESTDTSLFRPSRVGVIQSVNAAERMASLKWFPDAQLTLTSDMSVVLPPSFLGVATDEIESMSLYDIQAAHGTFRGIGDIVSILPAHNIREEHRWMYADVLRIMESPIESKEWIGEVIALDLDGRSTVRLGASSTNVRHVKIPWECIMTALNASGEGGVGEDEPASDGSMSESEMEEGWSGEEGVWRDENDEIVEEGGVMDEGEDWSTDEELDEDDAEMRDIPVPPQPSASAVEAPPADFTQSFPVVSPLSDPELPTSRSQPPPPNFSYSTMFADSVSTEAHSKPEGFLILEGGAPEDHHFTSHNFTVDAQFLRRTQKEHKILRSSLPDGVYVRTWESSLDLMRVLILGPIGTPYGFAPFVFDLHLDLSFPQEPPKAFFHSWTNGTTPVNPNLYTCGKICLSLLGTWPGDDKNETWSNKSTILQILVSILGLVLVKDPYFNEAGYEVRSGLPEFEVPAAMYAERAFFQSRAFVTHALKYPIRGFESEIGALYLTQDLGCPRLLERAICDAIEVIRRSEKGDDGEKQAVPAAERTVSLGALSPLRQRAEDLLEMLEGRLKDKAGAEWLRAQSSRGDKRAPQQGELFTEYQQFRRK